MRGAEEWRLPEQLKHWQTSPGAAWVADMGFTVSARATGSDGMLKARTLVTSGERGLSLWLSQCDNRGSDEIGNQLAGLSASTPDADRCWLVTFVLSWFKYPVVVVPV